MRQTAESRGIGVCLTGTFVDYTPQEMDHELSLLREAGVTWVRMDFDWSRIESTRGTYDWTATDQAVQTVRQYGMKVLGVVDYTPAWAQAKPSNNSHFPPADVHEFARFAGVTAQHYQKLGVVTWEIWNEPNLASFWMPAPDATRYAALLDASVAEIRQRVPGAFILSGGVAPAHDASDGAAVAPATFVSELYRAGVAQKVDAISAHPYSYPALASESGTGSWNSFIRLALLRSTMARYGDHSKPLWLTEFGAPTGSSKESVSETRQSEIIRSGLEGWARQPGMGPIFLYNGRDIGVEPTDPEANFGLLRNDFAPKVAYRDLQEFMGR